MKKTLMIYIIIPVHNRIKLTLKCLFSIFNQSDTNYRIVLIDDGSSDDTTQTVLKKYPNIKIIFGDGNLWWTRAINIGISYALEQKASAVLLLNNDVILPQGFIAKLNNISLKYNNCIIGANQVYDDESRHVIFSGGKINWKSASFSFNAKNSLGDTNFKESDFLPGRALFISSRIIEKIGFFDEKLFPHYGADLDFSLRAKKNRFKLIVPNDLSVISMFKDSYHKYKSNKSFKNLFRYLFSKDSSANLQSYINLAFRHSPKILIINALLIGILRRVLGYFKNK